MTYCAAKGPLLLTAITGATVNALRRPAGVELLVLPSPYRCLLSLTLQNLCFHDHLLMCYLENSDLNL